MCTLYRYEASLKRSTEGRQTSRLIGLMREGPTSLLTGSEPAVTALEINIILLCSSILNSLKRVSIQSSDLKREKVARLAIFVAYHNSTCALRVLKLVRNQVTIVINIISSLVGEISKAQYIQLSYTNTLCCLFSTSSKPFQDQPKKVDTYRQMRISGTLEIKTVEA